MIAYVNLLGPKIYHAGEEIIKLVNSCNVRCVGHVARKGKLEHGVTVFLAANMEESLADTLRQEDN
jgi:hypothetical protein